MQGIDEEYNTFLEFLKTTTAGQNNLYSVKVYSTADYSWLYTLLIFLGIGLLAVFFLRNMVRGLSGGPGGKSGLFDNGFKGKSGYGVYHGLVKVERHKGGGKGHAGYDYAYAENYAAEEIPPYIWSYV